MKNVEKHLVGWLSVCLLLCSYPVWAQGMPEIILRLLVW